MIGCFIEGIHLNTYKNSNAHFKRYIKSHKINYGRKYKLKSDKFFNSGFVIYSKNHKILFNETKIPFEIIAKDKMFPHQGYLCHAADENNFQLFDIGVKYNYVGSLIAEFGLSSDIVYNNYVFHLTSFLNKQTRIHCARILDRYFLNMV